MIFEEETIVSYFAHNREEDYETFEEAKQVVFEDINHYCNDYADLVRVKKVEVNADGSYKLLSGKLTHDELCNLEDSQYLCYSMYAGNGMQVFCNSVEKVNRLIALNKLKKVQSFAFVTKETMTVRDQTNDKGFVIPETVIVEGEDYPHDLGENPLASDYVQNGVGLNLINEFDYETITIEVKGFLT